LLSLGANVSTRQPEPINKVHARCRYSDGWTGSLRKPANTEREHTTAVRPPFLLFFKRLSQRKQPLTAVSLFLFLLSLTSLPLTLAGRPRLLPPEDTKRLAHNMANNAQYDYHTPEQTAPASPYGSGDPYYNKSSGYIASGAAPAKSSKRNWLKIGIPIAVLVIVGAVVGGVLGSRKSKKNSDSNGGNNSNNNNGNGNPSGGPNNGLARLPTSTDPFYGMPIYPSSVSPLPFSLDRGDITVPNFVLSCPFRRFLIG
jgi:hypothetical protein